MSATAIPTGTPDFEAIKVRQRASWSAGDYARIGTTLQIVGEELCEAVDLRAGEQVLDVAAGNGNATLAAARRYADVTSTDYVPALLERARARAEADGLEARFETADAENLPFPDNSFDVVLSTFGVMFAPDQERAARELRRVCRPGGRIGLASWTPDGFIGRVFKLIGRHAPPPPGVKPASRWGDPSALRELFGEADRITTTERHFVFRYRSPDHFIETFRDYYGPMLKTFEALDAAGRQALEAELRELLHALNKATDATLALPSAYLEAVVTKARPG